MLPSRRLADVLEPTPAVARLVNPTFARAEVLIARAQVRVSESRILRSNSRILRVTSVLQRALRREIRKRQRA